jgi:hypothetical protein
VPVIIRLHVNKTQINTVIRGNLDHSVPVTYNKASYKKFRQFEPNLLCTKITILLNELVLQVISDISPVADHESHAEECS